MSKSVASIVAGMLLALSCAVLADDAPPTLQERVGYAFSRALNAAQGDKQALSSLQTDAKLDAAAEYGLGEYYVFIKDYPQSIAWFRKSADQDFVGGYYGLGKAYDLGRGVTQDYKQAMILYLKAMELPEAEMHIGLLYAQGHGVKQDYAQAANWYRKAGSIEADLALGSLYQTGSGVKQDDVQAMQWYRKAADAGGAGDAQAQYRLGLMHEQSKSLQDYKQAAGWYQRASQQGVAGAQLNLGLLYTSGKGVPADPAKAVQQFQMAANQGNGQAQYHLAECFATGAGVPVDPVRAYQWMTIAKASLDSNDPTASLAAEKLKDLERQLSPAQTKQAKQAAAEWLQSHSAAKQ